MTTDNIIISLNSHYGTKNNGTYLSNLFFPFKGILSDNPLIKKKYLTLFLNLKRKLRNKILLMN